MGMQLGVDGVFVGSGIFKSTNPEKRAKAIVRAVTNYKNPKIIAEVSENLGEAMTGIGCDELVGRNRWAGRESGNLDEAHVNGPPAKKLKTDKMPGTEFAKTA